MPKILHAERSSNASSASRLGGSTLDPWEQASRKSYRSLLERRAIARRPFEDMLVRLAQKATASRETDPEEDFSNVTHGVLAKNREKLRRRDCG